MNTQKDIKGAKDNGAQCVGIHELIDWQIIQYRTAVDEHRHHLSKAEGRCVAWQEAEQDFNADDRRNMSDKWRVEYCGLLCKERKNCLVALRFFEGLRPDEKVHKVG